jgi:predicted DNA-binding ArsR family transcriptional regulator
MFADALHIEVAWTAPSDGGLPIRGYRVYKNGVHIPGTLETGPTILSLIITDNIVPGANYDISVAAFNEVGEGSKSAALTVMAAKIPDAPTGITMISQSSNAIAFRWTAPSDGGTPLIGYKIWWDNGLGGETSSFVEKIG